MKYAYNVGIFYFYIQSTLALIYRREKIMPFFGFVELRGLNGKTTRKEWKMQQTGTDGAAFTAALDGLIDIKDALDNITEATVQDYGVRYVVEGYTIGLGDLTEQALVNIWAEDPLNTLDALAISQVYIPAPVAGLFVAASGANMDVVDVADSALQSYIGVLAAEAFVSDHEVIDTGAGTAGMENGRRVTRKS